MKKISLFLVLLFSVSAFATDGARLVRASQDQAIEIIADDSMAPVPEQRGFDKFKELFEDIF